MFRRVLATSLVVALLVPLLGCPVGRSRSSRGGGDDDDAAGGFGLMEIYMTATNSTGVDLDEVEITVHSPDMTRIYGWGTVIDGSTADNADTVYEVQYGRDLPVDAEARSAVDFFCYLPGPDLGEFIYTTAEVVEIDIVFEEEDGHPGNCPD